MDVFPSDLPGLTWSILRAPKFATRKQVSTSGRVLAVADYPYPIWTWTLTYDFLRDGNTTAFGGAPGIGTGHSELRELMGFYVRQQGAFNVFLYDDPNDDSVTNQGIGSGDGNTTTYQLVRTLSAPSYGGLFTEPITQPDYNSVSIHVNGVFSPFTVGSYGTLILPSAPPPGALVTATFKYYWPVRFTEDTFEFENFMHTLWSLKKLTFESVLLP